MCLAVPAQVIELQPDEMAVVDLGGVRKEVCISLVDDVKIGDYLIIHVGFALTRLDPEEAEKTLALIREVALAVGAELPGRAT